MCPGRPEAHNAEIVELAIERIGARGDGVAQYRGEPVFVPFTVPGDRIRARLGARRHGGWEGFVADRLACGPIVGTDRNGRLIILGVNTWGGYAQYVKVPVHVTHLIPAELDFMPAAVVARHAPLAFTQLRERAKVKPGEWVLIMGAAGGLGSIERFLSAYERAGGSTVDRVGMWWWLIRATLCWGIICRYQAERHLSGQTRSVELAAIGRRVCETEWDLLDLLAATA